MAELLDGVEENGNQGNKITRTVLTSIVQKF